ncbi:MAG: endolytic transglycosylase MltG [Pseudomonadota bacterium]
MTRGLAANGMTALIVLMIGVLWLISWGRDQFSGPGPLTQAACVQVAPNSRMGQVSRQLVEMGAVTNARIFRIGADYTDRTDQLKAGSFLVEPGASMDEIIEAITRGGQNTCGTEIVFRIGVRSDSVQIRSFDPAAGRYAEDVAFDPAAAAPPAYATLRDDPGTRYRVVMAEGVTVTDAAEALAAADFLTGDVGALPAEGMLAPDSYEVRPGSGRAELIARMRAAQEARLQAAWDGKAAEVGLQSPAELLTLASIVEKETAVAEERGVVAAVFLNRLDRGMLLQTDPTIIYGITRGAGVLDREIRRSDIAGQTEQRLHGAVEYNTYQVEGLPPGPIANPGLAALEAAANPDTTDYLFFVADGTGGHAFAETLEEHNRNVAAYRALQAE